MQRNALVPARGGSCLPALFLRMDLASNTAAAGDCAAEGEVEGPASVLGKNKGAGQHDGPPQYHTVLAIGALKGEVIRGVVAADGVDATAEAFHSVEGTKLKVVAGCIWPSVSEWQRANELYNAVGLEPRGWAKKLGKFLSKTDYDALDVRIKLLSDVPEGEEMHESRIGIKNGCNLKNLTVDENMRDGAHEPCQLQVVELGPAWQHLLQDLEVTRADGKEEVLKGLKIGATYYPHEIYDRIEQHFQHAKAHNEKRVGRLCMRRRLWIAGPASGVVAEDGTAPWIDVHDKLWRGTAPALPLHELYEIDMGTLGLKRIRVPKGTGVTMPFLPAAAREVFVSLAGALGGTDAQRDAVWACLVQPGVGAGALKSLMQKAVRFGQPLTELPDETGTPLSVPTRLVMAAATLLCLSTRGDMYLPDLHISVRGITNACKRLAVIAAEDAWFADPAHGASTLEALLGLAAVAARCATYQIDTATAKRVALVAADLAASAAWVPAQCSSVAAKGGGEKVVPNPLEAAFVAEANAGTNGYGFVDVGGAESKQSLAVAALALRELRAFEGDMRMLENLSRMAVTTGKLPFRRADPAQDVSPDPMPIVHLIDQHVYPGTTHMVLTMTMEPGQKEDGNFKGAVAAPLSQRFGLLFKYVTGFNPRWCPVAPVPGRWLGEGHHLVRTVREAQALIAPSVFQTWLALAPPVRTALRAATVPLVLDPALIAQAVQAGGDLATIKVATTKEENDKDVAADATYDLAGTGATNRAKDLGVLNQKAQYTWELRVLLGVNSAEPTVARVAVDRPTEAQRNAPRITATARARAIEAFRKRSTTLNDGKGFRFKSALLPNHTHCRWNAAKQAWQVHADGHDAPSTIDWQWSDAGVAVPGGVPLLHRSELGGTEPEPILPADFGHAVWFRQALYAPRLPEHLRALRATAAASTGTAADGAEGADYTVEGAPLGGALPDGTAVLDELSATVLGHVRTAATKAGLSPNAIVLRLLSCLSGAYERASVPLPARGGDRQPDELQPIAGDWIVYRALVLLARAVPSALQVLHPTKLDFWVNDARALRCVEAALRVAARAAETAGAADAAPAAQAEFQAIVQALDSRWAAAAANATPKEHQVELVGKLMGACARGEANPSLATRGHMLQLNTGLGKTLIGLLFGLRWCAAYGKAKQIVWVTKSELVVTAYRALVHEQLGVDAAHVHIARTQDRFTDPKDGQLHKKRESVSEMFHPSRRIVILSAEALSGLGSGGTLSQDITDKLVEISESTFFVVDEVHLRYNNNQRNCNLLRAVGSAAKFLAMTATAWASPSALLAREWLKLCVNFPVETREDLFVALSGMLSGRVELFIDQVVHERLVPMDAAHQQLHYEALTGGAKKNWGAAVRAARDGTHSRFLDLIVEALLHDKKRDGGQFFDHAGVLVYCESVDAAKQIQTELAPRLAAAYIADGFCMARRPVVPRIECRFDPQVTGDLNEQNDVGVVLTHHRDVEGYNLQRLGAIVTGIFPNKVNARVQALGRITRLGQKRKSVNIYYHIPKNSILERLYHAHNSDDADTQSLESIAEVYEPMQM